MASVVLRTLHPFTGETSKIVKTTVEAAAEIEERAGRRVPIQVTASVYAVCRFLRWMEEAHIAAQSSPSSERHEAERNALAAVALATSVARIVRACVLLQSHHALDWYDRDAIRLALQSAAKAMDALPRDRLRRNRERETVDILCQTSPAATAVLRNAMLIRPDGMTEMDSAGNYIVSETACIAVDEIMRIVSQSAHAGFK